MELFAFPGQLYGLNPLKSREYGIIGIGRIGIRSQFFRMIYLPHNVDLLRKLRMETIQKPMSAAIRERLSAKKHPE